MTSQRFLYYVPWCITDASVIACGLGYNGKDKTTNKNKYDRILSIYILEVELGTSASNMFIVLSCIVTIIVLESHDSSVVEALRLQQSHHSKQETRN